MRSLFIILALAIVISFTTAYSHPDEIQELPGLNFPLNYKHYSGYVNATKGRHLHYWFVESQRSPSTDPVVLWLNGGPGCSALAGLLSENGPTLVSADGTHLINNTYSWNRVANMLFLEAPAGVGFSYADNKSYDFDDDKVSWDSYVALQNFFERFPEFKDNDFYITGESYAGIYVPTLAVRVLNGTSNINLKGFALGNGFVDAENQTNALLFFAYYHGLIGPQLWRDLSRYCCGGYATQNTCDFFTPTTPKCDDAVSRANGFVNYVNFYNIYLDCIPPNYTASEYVVQNLLRHLPKGNSGSKYHDYPPCEDWSNVKKWINQPSVREALHIPNHVQEWNVCSLPGKFNYTRLYTSMRPQILQLLNSGIRGLVYNGDVDIAVNYLGNEWFVDSLGKKSIAEYKPYTFNDIPAGFVKHYEGISFATVKGAGHMVPQDKPGPAFNMFSGWLSNSL